MKMAAVGFSVFAEFMFVKLQQYKQQSQLEQRQQQYENTMPTLAIQSAPSADTPHQTYDWNALGAREQHAREQDAREQQQRTFPQFLAECRELRLQLREQKLEYEKVIEEETLQHYNYLQRAQLGTDAKEETRTAEMKDLRRLVDEKQTIIYEQNLALHVTNQSTLVKQPDEQGKDLIWEMDRQKKGPWQKMQSSNITIDPTKEGVAAETLVYAMAAINFIAQAIGNWVDDCTAHGGNISDRTTVHRQIVVDWGFRVRQRMKERDVR